MRLKDLRLENWSVHEEIKVSFNDGLEISGRNGSGKSSILEALRFMFAKTGHGYNRFIQNGCRQALAQLEFTHDSSTYRLVKNLHVEKQSTVGLYRDDVQVADNATSAYQQMQDILAEDVIDKLLYVRQGELTLVLDRLSGREGKTELDRLFGLDKLETVWNKSGEIGRAHV